MSKNTLQIGLALTVLVLSNAPLAYAEPSGVWCVRDSSAPPVLFLESDTLPPCCSCHCDWDQSGVLGLVDLYGFTEDWTNENADYNADGATNLDDAIAFLICYLGSADGTPGQTGDLPFLRAQGMDY